MSRCQAVITSFLAWMSILPLLAVGAVLVYKPSLILHYENNDNDNDNDPPLENNDQDSFLVLLAGGVLLGQAIMHVLLLLPITGDTCCCCCCCFNASSYAIGIRPFSVYASRMSCLATAFTSLVLLVLTFWTLHQQQFQHEHHHHDDDDNNNNSTILVVDFGNNLKDDSNSNDNDQSYSGWSNDTYVLLLTASATSLALSTLSLVISFLPCSSSRTSIANNINHQQQQQQHDNDQEAALRQPLLQSSPRRGADDGTMLPRPRRVVEGV
jgi:hypothetical protein